MNKFEAKLQLFNLLSVLFVWDCLLHKQGQCRRLGLAQFTEKTILKVFQEIIHFKVNGATVLAGHSKAEVEGKLSQLFKHRVGLFCLIKAMLSKKST